MILSGGGRCPNEFAFQLYSVGSLIPSREIKAVQCSLSYNHSGSCLVQNPNNEEWYYIHGAEREPGRELVMDMGSGLFKEKT
jgi:hypothetical protein